MLLRNETAQAISDMDSVTQQNAALVEEAAAAAQSLRDQVGSLTHAVSVFKLDVQQAQQAPKAAPVRPVAQQAVRAPAKKAAPKRLAAAGAAGEEWEDF
ncbi:hypothetical protein [Massilia cavernae]|uniref:hypothetical protein n=1 Tax=Massilia cavernae TaxID=2320864 RepID=UPI000E6C7971|nr:hypothetical protein [Massilia cavernae]